jgi:hypothetical protein
MSELYTIERTPCTDLERFQALRIEALQREINKYKSFLEELQNDIKEVMAKEIEVIDFELL